MPNLSKHKKILIFVLFIVFSAKFTPKPRISAQAPPAIGDSIRSSPMCLPDLTSDGYVDILDASFLSRRFGGECQECRADLDKDGDIDYNDIAILTSYWGECPTESPSCSPPTLHTRTYDETSIAIDWTFPICPQEQQNSENNPPLGDVTGNGEVNITDSVFILQYLMGNRSANDQYPPPQGYFYLPACDVNLDEKCNVHDANIIQQCSVGINPGNSLELQLYSAKRNDDGSWSEWQSMQLSEREDANVHADLEPQTHYAYYIESTCNSSEEETSLPGSLTTGNTVLSQPQPPQQCPVDFDEDGEFDADDAIYIKQQANNDACL